MRMRRFSVECSCAAHKFIGYLFLSMSGDIAFRPSAAIPLPFVLTVHIAFADFFALSSMVHMVVCFNMPHAILLLFNIPM